MKKKFTCQKFLLLCVCCILAVSISGCQLLILPFYFVAVSMNLLSQLITLSITLPIRLLPLAAKYAPLALLFLENKNTDPEFYVELLEQNSYSYQKREFLDVDGGIVSVMVCPSESLKTLPDDQYLDILEHGKIILTENQHGDISDKELSAMWKEINGRQGTLWLVGKPAEEFRKYESEAMYV